MRIGLVVIVAGLAAIGLAAIVAGLDSRGLAILLGAIGINLLIVGSWFLIRPLADRFRRFLPPWLPW